MGYVALHFWHYSILRLTPCIFQLGCGGVFSPTHALLAHWFKKKRGLVLGYMAVGASVGGVVLPIAAHKLIPEVGCVTLVFLCHLDPHIVHLKLSLGDENYWLHYGRGPGRIQSGALVP